MPAAKSAVFRWPCFTRSAPRRSEHVPGKWITMGMVSLSFMTLEGVALRTGLRENRTPDEIEQSPPTDYNNSRHCGRDPIPFGRHWSVNNGFQRQIRANTAAVRPATRLKIAD